MIAQAPPPKAAVLDPLHFEGWDKSVEQFCGYSFFHSASWARVLQETYSHRPAYICSLEGAFPRAVLPVMEVDSVWTGRRGVSLPFTDFCDPAAQDSADLAPLYEALLAHGQKRGWRYLECRGEAAGWKGVVSSMTFYRHSLSLEGGEEALFGRMESAVRRAIRKARKAGLTVEFTHEVEGMRAYYSLHCQTRKRQGLPPQPWGFFEAIARHVCRARQGFVALAGRQQPVAAAVFLLGGRQAIFKYGASDYRWQKLRGNDLVLWEAARKLAREGVALLELGRTSMTNEGLRRFKLGFGAREETVPYVRYDFRTASFVSSHDRAQTWVNRVFRLLPLPLLRWAGMAVYPTLS